MFMSRFIRKMSEVSIEQRSAVTHLQRVARDTEEALVVCLRGVIHVSLYQFCVSLCQKDEEEEEEERKGAAVTVVRLLMMHLRV